MKAMQIPHYGPASDLTLVDVPIPTVGDDQVLIQIGAAGVNPVDTYVRSGTNNYTATFPHTPGNDGAGTIVKVGANVSSLSIGQRVYFSRNLTGSSAEFALALPDFVFPLPDNISFTDGACLGIPYTTAHRALFGRAHAQTGDKVLIHGATGAVGLATVQLALAAGLEVVASAGTQEGAELLEGQGVAQVIMHNQADHLAPFQSLDTGFDVIIEMLANINLDQDLKALKKGGRVAVVGNRGTIEINPRELMARDAAIVGVALANTSPAQLKEIAQDLYYQLAAGALNPVIRKTYALTELPNAHEDILKPGALGNLVIDLEV
ncbi:NADPH:quinone reductase [Maribrevibacterium harenarium]|uniref:NADPH:quinone reductase n=1 Tax=Maribrevibacterium harenarium TaxID=2589817 RepID=A0A501X431_9GAMM|nr:NADPH:quinone reductase [Maribrevibacterium harenarium]TPE55211.1 NADPH:quinone reductase [Maribrevibacterium harenarium]